MIKLPIKPTEFEIQADLYYKLKNLGYLVRGEVKIQKTDKIRGSRLDIFVSNGTDCAIVEVKKSGKAKKPRKSKQIAKYESYGYPVLLCRGQHMVDPVISQICSMFLPCQITSYKQSLIIPSDASSVRTCAVSTTPNTVT